MNPFLVTSLGIPFAILVAALVWALIDNRFVYKPPPDQETPADGGDAGHAAGEQTEP